MCSTVDTDLARGGAGRYGPLVAQSLLSRSRRPQPRFDSAEYFMHTPAFHHCGPSSNPSDSDFSEQYDQYMRERIGWEQYESAETEHEYFSALEAGQAPRDDDDAPMEGACDAECGAGAAMELGGDENFLGEYVPDLKRSPSQVQRSPAQALGRDAKRARLAPL